MDAGIPLSERLRPRALDDIVGQPHLTGSDGTLSRMVESGKLASIILWGPPGTGKTSIARLLAQSVGLRFADVSAVFSGVAELKKIFAEAAALRRLGEQMLLFVDEIHRFNRAQQDAFLPVVEDGTLILVGATTENPSFELNSALLSRTRVLTLRRLDVGACQTLLTRAEQISGRPLPLAREARELLTALADGDGRFLINQAEFLLSLDLTEEVNRERLLQLIHRRAPAYDKDRDGHFNLISALHKSMRSSDPDAALYYLARMLVAGENPEYILRRIIRFASEDVGLADPNALVQSVAAFQTYQILGSPEGELAIVQACLYCATAPKSNAAYRAQKAAWTLAQETASASPPLALLNAPTRLMKSMGYGADYRYDHEEAEGFSGQNCWPDGIARTAIYDPVDRGFERKIAERLRWWSERRSSA